MEADLGIDTVKQAELLSELGDRYSLPENEGIQLKDYPTLRHVIGYVAGLQSGAAPSAPAPAVEEPAVEAPAVEATPAPAAPAAPAAASADLESEIVQLVADRTGYPAEMLELDLDLEADLGIDTVKQAELLSELGDRYSLPENEGIQLKDYPTLRHVIGYVAGLQSGAASSASAPVASSPEPVENAPVSAPVDFSAVNLRSMTHVWMGSHTDVELQQLCGRGDRVVIVDDGVRGDAMAGAVRQLGATAILVQAPSEEGSISEDIGNAKGLIFCSGDVRGLFLVAKVMGESINQDGGFLLASGNGDVGGFCKSLRREWPDAAVVRAVRFASPMPSETQFAQLMMEELGRARDTAVVHWAGGSRWSEGLMPLTLDLEPEDSAARASDETWLVTGGAQGITAEIVHHVASRRGGVFHLIGRTQLPEQALDVIPEDDAEAKRAILGRMQAGGEKVTPVAVNAELKRLRSQQTILDTLARLRSLDGVEATYHVADVTDTDRIQEIVSEVLNGRDRIDWLVHAAGVEISRPIDRKGLDEFDFVLRPKVAGLENLLMAVGAKGLGTVVTFGSIAGRFGNPTQTDYASANDWMAWRLDRLRAERPEVKTLQLDWTAWSGAGMATRGSVAKVLDAAGIGFLPLNAGAAVFRRMIEDGVTGEVVIDCGLGMLEPATNEGASPPAPLFFGANAAVIQDGSHLRFSWPLSAASSWLNDHRIGGTPVVPGVMGLEAFGQVATALFPGARVRGFESVAFQTPLKLHGDRAHTAIVDVRPEHSDHSADGCIRLHCRLLSRFVGPAGEEQGPERLHFVATVVLDDELVPLQPVKPNGVPMKGSTDVNGSQLYDVLFHGPSFQVLTGTESYGQGWRAAVDNNRLGVPMVDPTSAPMELEALFQTVGVWQIMDSGTMGLPAAAQSVRIYGLPGREHSLECVVEREKNEAGYRAILRDEHGHVFVELNGYQTVSLA